MVVEVVTAGIGALGWDTELTEEGLHDAPRGHSYHHQAYHAGRNGPTTGHLVQSRAWYTAGRAVTVTVMLFQLAACCLYHLRRWANAAMPAKRHPSCHCPKGYTWRPAARQAPVIAIPRLRSGVGAH